MRGGCCNDSCRQNSWCKNCQSCWFRCMWLPWACWLSYWGWTNWNAGSREEVRRERLMKFATWGLIRLTFAIESRYEHTRHLWIYRQACHRIHHPQTPAKYSARYATRLASALAPITIIFRPIRWDETRIPCAPNRDSMAFRVHSPNRQTNLYDTIWTRGRDSFSDGRMCWCRLVQSRCCYCAKGKLWKWETLVWAYDIVIDNCLLNIFTNENLTKIKDLIKTCNKWQQSGKGVGWNAFSRTHRSEERGEAHARGETERTTDTQEEETSTKKWCPIAKGSREIVGERLSCLRAVVICFSFFSRNVAFGNSIGQSHCAVRCSPCMKDFHFCKKMIWINSCQKQKLLKAWCVHCVLVWVHIHILSICF